MEFEREKVRESEGKIEGGARCVRQVVVCTRVSAALLLVCSVPREGRLALYRANRCVLPTT
jgi:hypothetical protein